jgi:hypothetical protein
MARFTSPIARIGRQSDFETPEFLVYDGLHLRSRPLGESRWELGLYGGLPTHDFESSSQGDSLVGGYAQTRPWSEARLRFDWIHAQDERVLRSTEENLLGLELWQGLGGNWNTNAAYSALGGESRDVELRANWHKTETLVQLSYYRLFETQGANPLEFDTFQDVLFSYFPFERISLLASRDLSTRCRLEGGFDLREVEDEEDVSAFNRDVRRFHLTLALDPIFTGSTSLGLTADAWDGDGRETRTWGADLGHRLSGKTRVGIGSFYAAYEIDELLIVERQDVRTWFVSLDHQLSKSLELGLDFDYQHTDVDDFQTLRVQLQWRF